METFFDEARLRYLASLVREEFGGDLSDEDCNRLIAYLKGDLPLVEELRDALRAGFWQILVDPSHRFDVLEAEEGNYQW